MNYLNIEIKLNISTLLTSICFNNDNIIFKTYKIKSNIYFKICRVFKVNHESINQKTVINFCIYIEYKFVLCHEL